MGRVVKVSPINIIKPINNNYVDRKRVSFTGSQGDVFVKSQTTFKDAKKAIQLKYQSKLSKLRHARKKVLKQIDDINIASATNKEFLNAADGFGMFCNANNVPLKNKEGIKPFAYLYDMARENNVYTFAMTTEDRVVENCRAVICKDKKLGEKCLDAFKYYTEAHGVLSTPYSLDSTVPSKTLIDLNSVCFDKLPDTFDTTESFQSALLEHLEKNKDRYKKSKRPTVLQVENMERLLCKENSRGNIACMKDMMSNCWEEYHTVLTFHLTDLDSCDPGTTMSHRMAHKFDLDKRAITSSDIDSLLFKKDVIEPEIEKLKPLYSRYLVLTDKIETTKAECKKEIARAAKNSEGFDKVVSTAKPKISAPIKQTAENIVEQTVQVVDNTKKSLLNNKYFAIAFGAIAAVGVVAGVMYKMGKNQSAKQNKVAFQPINKVEAQPIKNAHYNYMPVQKSAVFSEFQKTI